MQIELKAKLLLEVIQDSLALFYKKYILHHQRIVGNFKSYIRPFHPVRTALEDRITKPTYP